MPFERSYVLNTPRPANPYSPQPNPATLSPARRLRPVIPASSYTPRVTPAPNPRRQPQPPTAAHSSSSRVSPTLANPIAAASSHATATMSAHEMRCMVKLVHVRADHVVASNSAPCSRLPRSSAASRTSLTHPTLIKNACVKLLPGTTADCAYRSPQHSHSVVGKMRGGCLLAVGARRARGSNKFSSVWGTDTVMDGH